MDEDSESLLEVHRLAVVGQVAAAFAHDLNNHLAVVNMTAEMLLEGLDDADGREDAEAILEAGQRAGELTHELLGFSRMGVSAARTVSVNDVLNEVQGTLQRLAKGKLGLRYELAEEPWPVVGDSGHLGHMAVAMAVRVREEQGAAAGLLLATQNVQVDVGAAARLPGLHAGPHALLCVATQAGASAAYQLPADWLSCFDATPALLGGRWLPAAALARAAGGCLGFEVRDGEKKAAMVLLPRAGEIPVEP